MMRRHGTWVVSASIIMLVALSALPAVAQTGSCQLAPVFVLMRDLLGRDRVGECTGPTGRNEVGDITQPTTRGSLTFRQADQVPTFSDGQTTWLYGPNGIESRPSGGRLAWETTGYGAPSTATPTPNTYAQTTTYATTPTPTPWGQTGNTWPQQAPNTAQQPPTNPQQPGTTWPQTASAPPSAPLPNALPPGPSGPPPAANSLPPAPFASPTVLVPTELPISLDGDDSSTSEPVNLAGGNYAVRWEARLINGNDACYVGSRLRRFDDQNPGALIAHTTLGSSKDRSVGGESRLFSVPPGRYVVDVATTGCAWKLIIQAP
jgi:hypothetical protein